MLARIRKAQEEREGGFTLIELLVVIIIIGILAAIAIPVFLNQRKKGWDSQAKSDLRNAATGEETYLTDNSSYTDVVGNLTAATVGFKQTGGVSFTTMAAYDSTGAKVTPNLTATPPVLAGGSYCIVAQSQSGNFFVYNSGKGGLATTVATTDPGCPATN
jgi:type IV pilus assembly protein PilA